MKIENIPSPFPGFINLAADRLGAKALYANDDFFAEKENLIRPGRGIFIADKYTDRGKWMDGWESKRRRTPGHDWCIVQLGVPGIIKGFDIDTNHFLGNHPPFASIQAAYLTEEPSATTLANDEIEWTTILEKSPLNPGSQHFFESATDQVWTHVKLNIFPDGGVARLKVYGTVVKDWSNVAATECVDLIAAVNGGKAIHCNDMFFSAMENLILPNRGINMGDGWETKRNRIPNNSDWVILKMATRGQIKRIVVDTNHFKGNYPDRCALEGCVCKNDEEALSPETSWTSILPEVKLAAHQEHFYESEIQVAGPFTHLKLKIFPDGGISRLRVLGHVIS
ncbi:MAG: allantoicase [Saprospiraceae bacterium]